MSAKVSPIISANRDVMLEQLKMLFGRAMEGLIEVTALRVDDPHNSPRHCYFAPNQLEEAVDWAVKANSEDMRNVYVGAALRHETTFPDDFGADKDVQRTYAVWADADDEDQLNNAIAAYRAANLPPAYVVVTGRTPNKRAQLWWPLETPITDLDVIRETTRGIAIALGTDRSVATGKQLMRLAGSLAWPKPKKEGRVLEVTELTRVGKSLSEISLEQIHKAFPKAEHIAREHQAESGGSLAGAMAEADLRSALEFMASDDRDVWVRMGHALKELGEIGYRLWIDWSKKSDKYEDEDAERVWASFKPDHTGYQAVFAEAQRQGWINPGAGSSDAMFRKEDTGEIVNKETGEIVAERPKKAAKEAADAFPDELTRVPGVVGEIVNWIEATSRHPQRALALVVALGIVGTIAGRKYATPTYSGTHLYTLALAPTGAGKNHAPKQGRRIMRALGQGTLIGPSKYMSMSAVFSELGKRPSHIAFMDEFGGEMRRIASTHGSPHERAVKDILRTAWGASFEELSPLSYADGRHIEPVISPSLSICGMSTAEEFYAAIAGDDIFNGFLNRFLIVRVPKKPVEVEPTCNEFEVPSGLQWALAKIKDRVTGGIMAEAIQDPSKPVLKLEWGVGAQALYKALRTSLEAEEENEALLSRVAEMAVRLATIRAIGRDVEDPAPMVEMEDMIWGREVALLSARRMIVDARSFMAETEHQIRTMQILRIIREAEGSEIRRSDLIRKLQHKYDARTLDSVIHSLMESEDIIAVEGHSTSKGGRKPVSYALLSDV